MGNHARRRNSELNPGTLKALSPASLPKWVVRRNPLGKAAAAGKKKGRALLVEAPTAFCLRTHTLFKEGFRV